MKFKYIPNPKVGSTYEIVNLVSTQREHCFVTKIDSKYWPSAETSLCMKEFKESGYGIVEESFEYTPTQEGDREDDI